jgi:hypothetical protein
MAPEIAEGLSPDAVLIAACAAARAAVAAYNAEAEKDEPGEVLSPLFEQERLALECVAVTSANTARGVAAKAALLADYSPAADGSEPSQEISWRWSGRWLASAHRGLKDCGAL